MKASYGRYLRERLLNSQGVSWVMHCSFWTVIERWAYRGNWTTLILWQLWNSCVCGCSPCHCCRRDANLHSNILKLNKGVVTMSSSASPTYKRHCLTTLPARLFVQETLGSTSDAIPSRCNRDGTMLNISLSAEKFIHRTVSQHHADVFAKMKLSLSRSK